MFTASFLQCLNTHVYQPTSLVYRRCSTADVYTLIRILQSLLSITDHHATFILHVAALDCSSTQQCRDVDGTHDGPRKAANHNHDPSPVRDCSIGHDETAVAFDARRDDAASLRMGVSIFGGRGISRADHDARIVAVGAGGRFEATVGGWSDQDGAGLH